MKLCINCKHFKDTNSIPLTNWTKMFCTHPKVKSFKTVDPVTGKKAFIGNHTSLQGVISDREFPNADRVNTSGNCGLFKEKINQGDQ